MVTISGEVVQWARRLPCKQRIRVRFPASPPDYGDRRTAVSAPDCGPGYRGSTPLGRPHRSEFGRVRLLEWAAACKAVAEAWWFESIRAHQTDRRGVGQWSDGLPWEQEVGGSNPPAPTIIGPIVYGLGWLAFTQLKRVRVPLGPHNGGDVGLFV